MPQNSSLIDLLTAITEPKPVAYDRRFKIPIRIRYDMSDNAMASYKPGDGEGRDPLNRPAKISLNGKYATGWQQGENEKMDKAVKHELVHHVTPALGFSPYIFTPSTSLVYKLISLFSPQPELYSARDKVMKNSQDETIKNMGGTARVGQIYHDSEWLPWLLTDTMPKGLDEKFTPGEKQALKKDLTEQYGKYVDEKYQKYKSIWE